MRATAPRTKLQTLIRLKPLFNFKFAVGYRSTHDQLQTASKDRPLMSDATKIAKSSGRNQKRVVMLVNH